MTTTTNHTYIVHVIDDSLRLHAITVEAPKWQGVKATARKIATGRGVKVRYIESMHVVA